MKQVLIINNCTQHEVNIELMRLQQENKKIISIVINYTPMMIATIIYETED